jgi:serine/threonine-protein kinase HipA
MKRRESALARFEQRKENRLFESDYLLGVYDANRMGALRFKTSIDGDFLDNNKERATPPWTSIRELEQISLKLENDAVSDDPDYLKWLNMLVAPASSLGGARPKASIIDAEGQLWIAKFPSNNDFTDQGAWEMLIQELAIHCGINMSKSVAKRFSSRHHTYLTKRFDRKVNGTRIHFASAMTLLGRIDGDDAADGGRTRGGTTDVGGGALDSRTDLRAPWSHVDRLGPGEWTSMGDGATGGLGLTVDAEGAGGS